MADNGLQMTIYHVGKPKEGVTMYEVDARAAIANHPSEWSATPWDDPEELPAVKLKNAPAPADPSKVDPPKPDAPAPADPKAS